MSLAGFARPDPIFIDANIFVYHFHHDSPYHAACTAFLRRVETGELTGAISTLIVDEVVYALLMHKGSQVLQTTRLSLIKRRLTTDRALANQCYAFVHVAMEYLESLRRAGLQVLDIPFELMHEAVRLGSHHNLLPRDAMHYAACLTNKVFHLASRDAHFRRLPHLKLWSP